jgi:hypothetical protein
MKISFFKLAIFDYVIERPAAERIKISRVSPALVHRVLLEFPWPNQSIPSTRFSVREQKLEKGSDPQNIFRYSPIWQVDRFFLLVGAYKREVLNVE